MIYIYYLYINIIINYNIIIFKIIIIYNLYIIILIINYFIYYRKEKIYYI